MDYGSAKLDNPGCTKSVRVFKLDTALEKKIPRTNANTLSSCPTLKVTAGDKLPRLTESQVGQQPTVVSREMRQRMSSPKRKITRRRCHLRRVRGSSLLEQPTSAVQRTERNDIHSPDLRQAEGQGPSLISRNWLL